MSGAIREVGLWECAPRKIVVLRALQLGDLLCAVPALRALRAAAPDAEIALVGLPWARAFVDRFDAYLDRFIEFPGFPGLPERAVRVEEIPGFLDGIQRERFDLAIQLHGSGSFVNPLTGLFGARKCAGFYREGEYRPNAEHFMVWPETGLEIRRLLGLMDFLGAPTRGDELEFPITQADLTACYALFEGRELRAQSFVCIHAGASVPERRWPPENFAAVGRMLANRGFDIVLTGTSAEHEVSQSVARGLSGVSRRVIDVTGRTDLGSLGALLSRARLLITNDTGISHVAAGLRVPSVVISTGNNPARWSPIDAERHRVVCTEAGVQVPEVVNEVEKLLRASSGACTVEVAADRSAIPLNFSSMNA